MSPLSRHDAALALRDPQLPALALLLDDEGFRARLARELPGVELGAVLAHYIRYKVGTSCVVAYLLEHAGAEIELHAVTWRSGGATRLAKAAGRRLEPGPLGGGLLLLADLHTAVWIFPNDLEVRALRRLGNADKRRRLLRKLAPGRPDLGSATLSTLAYKPARRYVGRLTSESGESAVVRLYAGAEFALRANAESRLRSTALIRLPEALGSSERHRAVLLEWLAGDRLSERLGGADFSSADVEAAGAALAELHAQPGAGLSARAARAGADELLADAEVLRILLPERAAAIALLARRLCNGLPESDESVPIHGDLNADQIVIDRGRVGFLDLDRAAKSTRSEDLANFLAYFEHDELLGRLPAGRAEVCAEALLEGYRRGGGRVPAAASLGRHRTAVLLRLATKPFRSRDPDWRARVERLVDRVENEESRQRIAGGRSTAVRSGGAADSARSPLELALERLSQHEPTGCLAPAAVTRVEVRELEEGSSLILTVETAGGERWLQADQAGLRELRPEEDRALPLARTLGGAAVLSYRPGRRLVVCREAEGGVEKGYRRARWRAAAQRHELVSTLAGTIDGLALPRLRELRAPSASFLLERLAGPPLRLEPQSVGRYETFGRGLRAFQEADPGTVPPPTHGVDEEFAVLERWLARARFATGTLVAGWDRGYEAARRRAATLSVTSPGLAHGDLHDGQLRDGGDAVALLDFDLLALADPALDVGNLLAHFELRWRQRLPGADAETAAAARRALLGGLGRSDEPDFPARLAFYQGTSLLRLALVYQLRPRWAHLAPALAEEGLRCLDTPG